MPRSFFRAMLPGALQRASVWSGMAIGLAAARWVAESSGHPWRMGWLFALGSAGLLAGAALGALPRAQRSSTWPGLICWLYALWPIPQPDLGAIFIILSIMMLSIMNFEGRGDEVWGDVAIFGAALALYIHTLAPTVLPADAGEFQIVAPLLGIAHPPGYPLYTLLGKLFTLLPVGDMAYRVNLFAAVCGAATLAVVARCAREASGSRWGGLLAAMALGLSPTFWAQSTTANIRSLTALFAALCLWLALRWEDSRQGRWLTWLGLCLGLGIGHHASLALLGAPLVIFPLVREPRLILSPRRWLGAVGAGLASFVLLLYLPLRSAMQPAFDPTPIRTLEGLMAHVLATGFRGDMLHYRTAAVLWQRAGVWLNILAVQFGPWLLGAMTLALGPLWQRRRAALALLTGAGLINVLSALTYRAPQTVEYLIPSYVVMAILLGGGLGLLWCEARGHRMRSAAAASFVGLALLAALAQGARSYPSLRAQHTDRSERRYAAQLLSDAPQGALILANWHHATALWYLQLIEGLRPDIEVRYVYPQGATPNEAVWLAHVDEAIAARPVIVTNRFHAYAHTTHRWIPFHDAWLVRRDPLLAAPSEIIPREALCGEVIRVLGYQLETDAPQPGGEVVVRVYWQPLQALEEDYSTFVQLLGPGGVVGQGDIAQPTRGYLPHEVRVDVYRFPLLLHTQPADYRLVTGFYTATASGWERLPTPEGDVVTLQDVSVHPLGAPVATRHQRAERWANGLRLTGVDVDRTLPSETRLYLHWQRMEPLWPAAQEAANGPARLTVWVGSAPAAQAQIPALSPGQAATVAIDLPPSVEEVTLDLANAEGVGVRLLGAWHRPVARQARLRLPARDRHYLPLGGQMALVGLKAIVSGPQPEATLTVAARFLALRPLTEDNSVSLGLRGDGWEIKQDDTPAQGAIPTLKWITGWQVDDRRALSLDAAPRGAEGQLVLSVYDAFTLQPLHVLDERLARQGQGIELSLGMFTVPP